MLVPRLFLLLSLLSLSHCFYLPGVAPRNYDEGENVDMKVNYLTSVHTQLPYRYYDLPFCRPKHIRDSAENLGEILMGEVIENSNYSIRAMEDTACTVVCTRHLHHKDVELFRERIKEEYRVHWIIDNLPSATKLTGTDQSGVQQKIYDSGFPLGEVFGSAANQVALNNHVDITLLYHTGGDFGLPSDIRIVGFEVFARSVAFSDAERMNAGSACSEAQLNSAKALEMNVAKGETLPVPFTYTVHWQKSDVRWAYRWDTYLKMTDSQIHWFSIVNSVMIVFFLTGMVAMIMMRTLHADFRHYRELENSDEAQEETGWKLVHGDVFRPPMFPMLLSVFVGTGVQVFSMSLIIMIFAVLGFLSPANRGGLMTATLVLFVMMGVFAGYFSARVYKMFKGKKWKKTTILTAFLLPGIVFGLFFVLDVLIWDNASSGAVPFFTLVELILLWFCVSVPLTFFGAYFGYKKPVEDPPVRVNQIPRQVPDQVWYMRPIFSILMGGILPFGAIFIELYFVLTSIWKHQFYYMFGFLFIVFIILLITCAEITIVMCYFQLCSEDYHWWWRSYLTSGASAFYMMTYAAYYFTQLQITKFVAALLYFGYTAIMALVFFVLTGTVGFYSCYFFVRKIYGSIKVD